MSVLQSFVKCLEAGYADEQWARVRAREAERLGLQPQQWAALRAMPIDLVTVREVHRHASQLASVRRADREGAWTLVSAQVGKLRSQPQSFRVGSHVEPAWDHTTLRRRVAELVNVTRGEALKAPVSAVASFIHSFVRAQPFLGQNERVSVLVSSLVLRSVGLPSLDAGQFERALGPTLIAPRSSLEQLVENSLWSEALALAEWLTPARSTGRWTLADEHAASTKSRRSGDLATLERELSSIIEQRLPALAAARRSEFVSFADRLRIATDTAHRGHLICPHEPIFETRWALPSGHDIVSIIAMPGRGLVGAATALLSIEHPRVINMKAPALLLPLDEPVADRAARLGAWLPTALPLPRLPLS